MQCGFMDDRILQLDHKYGDGAEDRRSFGTAHVYYRYYLDNPIIAKRKLQVLCPNCHWVKSIEEDGMMGKRYVKNGKYS